MKSILFFLLCGTLFCSCTANAQTSINKPATIESPASCMTAAPLYNITVAPNIAFNSASIAAEFKGYSVFLGRTWDCLAIYEEDNVLYFGDHDYFWLNDTTLVTTGGEFKVTIDIVSGTAIMKEAGPLYRNLVPPTYDGPCSRPDWRINNE